MIMIFHMTMIAIIIMLLAVMYYDWDYCNYYDYFYSIIRVM